MSTIHEAREFPARLNAWVDSGVVDSRHLGSVAALVSMAGSEGAVDDLAWVAFALVLAAPATGHTCIDFDRMELWLEDGSDPPPGWTADAAAWATAVTSCTALVDAAGAPTRPVRAPFVLDGHRLYSARSFAEEVAVARNLRERISSGTLKVLTGGPGSGKTTAVAEMIVDAVNAGGIGERIALAAPTGLAAKRMSRALVRAVAAINSSEQEAGRTGLSDDTLATIGSLPKSTVHRLLGYNPGARSRWFRNVDNPLEQELVVVDEVSMMDLSMMSRLLDAVGPGSTVMLVGDPFQLASVDAGSVLADIVRASDAGSGFVVPRTGNYRFKVGSPVYEIAAATKAGDTEAVVEAMRRHHAAHAVTPGPHFAWVHPEHEPEELNRLARSVVGHARRLCSMAASAGTDTEFKELLAFRDGMQVVCAHRRGNLGVSGWNSAVERELGPLATGQWYPGRPVMVTSNDPFTKLANGDIGVVCGSGTERVVVFGSAEHVETFPVARMPHVETVHALTIHKSQGSEYAHTIVVLPLRHSRILTRELLYTGMTRAKSSLTIVASEEIIRATVGTEVRRATGLADRL